MADEKELRDLCERIASLGGRDQTRLLEMVLAENRRRYEAAVAEVLAQNAALLAHEKLRNAVPIPFKFPPEAKREAG